jgi:HK97 family phage major capsid protein
MDMSLVELREELDESLALFQAAADAIEEAGDDADLDKLQTAFDEAEERYTNARNDHRKAVDRQERARKRFELMERTKDARKLTEEPDKPSDIKVGKEPLTYQRNNGHSIFADLYRASKFADSGAAERLSRHQREMAMERGIKDGIPAEKFDLSSTDSAGGYLVAPLYLQEQFVDYARAGRVVANTLGPRPLPPNTDSINLPTMSGGTAVATQADGGAVTETDATFSTVSADVKTVAGMQDVSQQLVDRSVPGVDEVIFADLAKAYHVKLDTDVINSATSNNLGLLQVSGINSVTYTDASPTVGELYPKLADAIQLIHTNVFAHPGWPGYAEPAAHHPVRPAERGRRPRWCGVAGPRRLGAGSERLRGREHPHHARREHERGPDHRRGHGRVLPLRGQHGSVPRDVP